MVISKEHRIFSRSFAQVEGSNDDDIFRGVSLITAGPAKGHNVEIDQTTLEQLLECAKRFKNGVRANLGHFTGVENAFGFINNLRISGKKLLGDLNLFEEHPDYRLIKRQINTIADTIGFSVFFDGPDEEKEIEVDGSKASVFFARCVEFFSSDLVGEPAANPSGVFNRQFIQGPTARGQVDASTVDSKKGNMAEDPKQTPEDMKSLIKECMSECMKSHADHMSKMDDAIGELTKKVESIGTNDTPVKTDKSAADLEKEQGKVKDSSPGNPGGSAMDDEKKDKDKMIDEKEMNRRIEASAKALRAEITDDLMKRFAAQKISPPATATAASATDGAANGDGKTKHKTYHEACRSIHALDNGKSSKTDCMKLAAEQNPDLYKAYTKGQENGEAWTREPLFMSAEKKQRNLSIIASGRLI
jgi:hypothetical protein